MSIIDASVIVILCLVTKPDNYLLIFLIMQERFYFGDHVLPLFETGIPLLKQRLHQLPDAEKVNISPHNILWQNIFYIVAMLLVSIIST